MTKNERGTLQTFSGFRPTRFDAHISIPGLEDWLVAPCSQTRDSGCLERSNFANQLQALSSAADTTEDYETHTFGHWAIGWFEIALVRPGSKCEQVAREIKVSLDNYPILDEDHHSALQEREAGDVWESCYTPKNRVQYIRDHRSQFDFHSFGDLLACVRGKYFAGCASELLGSDA
jgi:hypothetical protein